MLPSSYCGALFAYSILILPFGQAQFVVSLPQCVQNCIAQIQDGNCQVTDVKCLCRASAGNFLPDLITCMHGECDNGFDNDLLLTPLQLVCEIAGTPIPASALTNAEHQTSTLASQPTVTVTVSSASATASTATATTTSESSSLSTDTASFSSVHTYTTTNSRGSTATQKTTYTETTKTSAHISSSTNDPGATTLTTTVAGAKTSSTSTAKSRTTTAPPPDSTNSAPFKNTNGNSAVKREVLRSWLGLSILISFGCIWL